MEDFKQQGIENYGADSIQVLEGLEAVRKRPSMYIGDISSRGLHHLVNEVVDNSIDEALAGFCDRIEVSINEDNSITVSDNGRGIPVGMHEKEHRSALEVVMTVLHAGGKFNKSSYKVSGGLHGVGVSCVNALSDFTRVEVARDGKLYRQEYSCGKPTTGVDAIGDADYTGTKVIFHPDASIFTETVYKYDILANRMRELAFLNAGITIVLTDLRSKDENGNYHSETFHSDEGVREFVKYLEQGNTLLMSDIIHLKTDKYGAPVEVAMAYDNGFGDERIHSYVNNIHTQEEGTHVAGFRQALTRVLKKYADDSKLVEKAKLVDKEGNMLINPNDFKEGLTAVISVKVAEPQFEGQTKTKLGNSEIAGVVNQAVGEALTNYLEEHPEDGKAIIEKVIVAAQARIAARNARDKVQRKNPLTGGGLPGKLADCKSKDAAECELFIVEGDSAGGSAKDGRDSRIQAILPLRGKILNVEKAMYHKVFESETIQNIFAALGVKFNEDKTLDISHLRYHKTIIMTDADVDGAHIATLIMTLFFRYMRELIDMGCLYIATPPLYLCKKGDVKRYLWTDMQRQQFIDEFGGGDERAITTQRYKGLGEMNAEQLWETTMDPAHRTLRLVTIENAMAADHAFSMLMGEDVAPRREFIEQNATYANIDA